MNNRERILYIHGIISLLDREYLKIAPQEAIDEYFQIFKTALNQGLTWNQENPSILEDHEKPDQSDASSDNLGTWHIIETSA